MNLTYKLEKKSQLLTHCPKPSAPPSSGKRRLVME